MAQTVREAALALCERLNLDPKKISKAIIVIEVNRPLIVQLTTYPNEDVAAWIREDMPDDVEVRYVEQHDNQLLPGVTHWRPS